MSETLENRVLKAIEEIANGKTMKKALQLQGLSRDAFYNALDSNPQIKLKYVRAEHANADAIAEEILEIADTEDNAQKARNQIDARKWLASKRAPKKYGDRIDVAIEGNIDLNAAIETASRRILLPNSYLSNSLTSEHIEMIELTPSESTGSKPVSDDERKAIDDLLS